MSGKSLLTLKIPAPEKRFWTRSGSKPKIGGKSNFYHFLSENRLKNGLKTLQIAIIYDSLVHRRYMVFSGRVHRPKTGPFHSKAGIHVTKKCCNGADNLFKKFRMCPCRGYDHLFLEKSASRLALFQSRDPYLGGGYLALHSCYKFRSTMMHMDMMKNDSEHKLFNSESLPTIQYYQHFGYV